MDSANHTGTTKYISSKPAPEISIEWQDVQIEVKVLGADLPPQETEFVRYISKCIVLVFMDFFINQIVS